MAKKVIEELETLKTEPVEEVNGNVVEELQAVKEEISTFVNPVDKAYSIVFDEKTARWQAIEIVYDHVSGVLGGMKVIESNPNKYIIVDRFQVLVGRNLM